MECPVCRKEFDEHTGRRPKKFCSDRCKVKYWNSQKIKSAIIKEDLEDEKMAEELADDKDVTKILSEINNLPPPTEIEKSIAVLENELMSVPDIGLGKKRRQFLESRIKNLKSNSNDNL